ncbi:MAG: hypothetical protein RR132_05270 [Rikenellaceae bacterium]
MGNIDNKIDELTEKLSQEATKYSGDMTLLFVAMTNYLSLVQSVNEAIEQSIALQAENGKSSCRIKLKGVVINQSDNSSHSNIADEKKAPDEKEAPNEKKKSEEKATIKFKDVINKGKTLLVEAKKVVGDTMDAFEGIDDSTKAVVGAAFDIGAATLSGVSSISSLVGSSSKGVQTVVASASASMEGLEKASAILQILAAAIAITKAIFQMCDADNEKVIKRNEQRIKSLQRDYKVLAAEIEKAYGFDKSAKLNEQTENLEKQKQLIEEQKAAEDSKKSTDKTKMDEYEDKLVDINIQIEKNKEAAVDAVFGADLDSAISDFTDAYLSAWESGGQGAEVQGGIVKKMIKGMINEIMKSNIAEKVKALRELIKNAMAGDGIDASEQSEIDYQADEIYRQMEADSKGAEMYIKGDEMERDATTKGFGAITQESANELNGKFTTIQEHTAQIRDSISTLVLNSGGMLQHLAGIESNTSHCLRLATIEKDMSAVKAGIGIMTTKGIKML